MGNAFDIVLLNKETVRLLAFIRLLNGIANMLGIHCGLSICRMLLQDWIGLNLKFLLVG